MLNGVLWGRILWFGMFVIFSYDRASLRNKCYITGIVKKQKPYKLYICFLLFSLCFTLDAYHFNK